MGWGRGQGAFHVNSTLEICQILPNAMPRLCNIENGGLGRVIASMKFELVKSIKSGFINSASNYSIHSSAQIDTHPTTPSTYSLTILH